MPKYSVPKLEAKPILTNDEALQLTFKPKIIHKREPSANMQIREPKEPIYKNKWQPEAGILIQNTEKITEIYTEKDP